jgi:hypothetical protein
VIKADQPAIQDYLVLKSESGKILKPTRNEGSSEFLERCMNDANMKNDWPDDSLRDEVCRTSWQTVNEPELNETETVKSLELYLGDPWWITAIRTMTGPVHEQSTKTAVATDPTRDAFGRRTHDRPEPLARDRFGRRSTR